jgi:hypothetical protein
MQMATIAKDKGISPGAVLLIIGLLIALAAGGASHLAGGGAGTHAGASGGFHDPCQDKGPGHLLGNWRTRDGREAWLVCGDSEKGWRHIVSRHEPGGASASDILDCIASTLINGTLTADGRYLSWQWGPKAGNIARVGIARSGEIRTAFSRRGGWLGCVGK